jgi:hypothetical protein
MEDNMDKKIVILIDVALVGRNISGFTGAYLFYFLQLKRARQEIEILTTKLRSRAQKQGAQDKFIP